MKLLLDEAVELVVVQSFYTNSILFRLNVCTNIGFQECLAQFRRIKDQETHFALRSNLIDHMWGKYISHASL